MRGWPEERAIDPIDEIARLRCSPANGYRSRPQAPSGPNQVWCYDFVFDHCANGQQLKCLTVADEFTKEGLAIDVDGRIRSARVIEVLSRLVSARGAPRFLRSDNGPEFVSKTRAEPLSLDADSPPRQSMSIADLVADARAVDWDFTNWCYASGYDAHDPDARRMFECLLAYARREGRTGLH